MNSDIYKDGDFINPQNILNSKMFVKGDTVDVSLNRRKNYFLLYLFFLSAVWIAFGCSVEPIDENYSNSESVSPQKDSLSNLETDSESLSENSSDTSIDISSDSVADISTDSSNEAIFEVPPKPTPCEHPQVVEKCENGWYHIEPGCYLYGSYPNEPYRSA